MRSAHRRVSQLLQPYKRGSIVGCSGRAYSGDAGTTQRAELSRLGLGSGRVEGRAGAESAGERPTRPAKRAPCVPARCDAAVLTTPCAQPGAGAPKTGMQEERELRGKAVGKLQLLGARLAYMAVGRETWPAWQAAKRIKAMATPAAEGTATAEVEGCRGGDAQRWADLGSRGWTRHAGTWSPANAARTVAGPAQPGLTLVSTSSRAQKISSVIPADMPHSTWHAGQQGASLTRGPSGMQQWPSEAHSWCPRSRWQSPPAAASGESEWGRRASVAGCERVGTCRRPACRAAAPAAATDKHDWPPAGSGTHACGLPRHVSACPGRVQAAEEGRHVGRWASWQAWGSGSTPHHVAGKRDELRAGRLVGCKQGANKAGKCLRGPCWRSKQKQTCAVRSSCLRARPTRCMLPLPRAVQLLTVRLLTVHACP